MAQRIAAYSRAMNFFESAVNCGSFFRLLEDFCFWVAKMSLPFVRKYAVFAVFLFLEKLIYLVPSDCGRKCKGVL